MSKLTDKIEKIYPLTSLQEGMLFHYMIDPNTTDYILQYVLDIEVELSVDNVVIALDLLAKRYSILRTVIFYENIKKPQQIVLKERKIEFNHIIDDETKNFNDYLEEDLQRTFDLQKGSLVRVTYVEGKHKIIWTIHHIIVDGWSISILFDKFMYYYNLLQQEGILQEVIERIEHEILLETQNNEEFSSYVSWLNTRSEEKADEYWRNLLANYDSYCNIPIINKVTNTKDKTHRHTIEIDYSTTIMLKRIAEECESTINTVSEVVCGILLQYLNGSEDVVFGKVVSGRNADIKGIGVNSRK